MPFGYQRDRGMRDGQEWNVGDRVCPERFARDGSFARGEVIAKIPLPCSLSPYTVSPASRNYQNFIYIVEWPAPGLHTPDAMDSDVFFGDRLLTWDRAIAIAEAILEKEISETTQELMRKKYWLENEKAWLPKPQETAKPA